eukprot:CAMPEP_0206433430 /NCGR_PEP_ID=MMETSP0324_2-20121206/8526_1 /ASSEMBLY_ACC=CAM_ASM_000836 /TAXON_ID=2866 /ORGANISM="Crypthecodinium cohnii, Strain Seligo" /LENGTH=233 /DNA_ID=CAMNT_0053899689 /DNA_START=40 /DNA_END=741 /DNA_ORIENTATION=-
MVRAEDDEPSVTRAMTVPAALPPPELHSSQDMLAWKREYNIRLREAEWKRRQEELLTQKQVAWQIERCERENRLQAARETRRREMLEKRVHSRHMEVDRKYKERCRNVEIERKHSAWEEKENARLMEMHSAAKEAQKVREEVLAADKARLCEEQRAAAHDRAEAKRHQQALDAKREENIRKREAERQRKAAEEAQKLKKDHIAHSSKIVSEFTERRSSHLLGARHTTAELPVS